METSAYFLDSPGAPLQHRSTSLATPGRNEVVVEVQACGLCHTDLSFADGSVAPRHDLPLVLGHEITGRVVEAGEGYADWIGRPVLVPAVLPCGECDFCRAGRGNACPNQKMPGNDLDGGFARHLVVPGGALISLEDAPEGFALDDLAVVADAVSTAYQAVVRSGLEEGDQAIVVGAGGVGGFVVQIARALGARVAACDVDAGRLKLAGELGAG
ncbi:MAG TPA: alcohol dehydrogenase catalytic domain-containing protein, partial [Thermoanaerobaculia bacterium]|nr:alcohol dehydrogenase catalytic domain-containing protein [Thermoanaerobaculia bacterium]